MSAAIRARWREGEGNSNSNNNHSEERQSGNAGGNNGNNARAKAGATFGCLNYLQRYFYDIFSLSLCPSLCLRLEVCNGIGSGLDLCFGILAAIPALPPPPTLPLSFVVAP